MTDSADWELNDVQSSSHSHLKTLNSDEKSDPFPQVEIGTEALRAGDKLFLLCDDNNFFSCGISRSSDKDKSIG